MGEDTPRPLYKACAFRSALAIMRPRHKKPTYGPVNSRVRFFISKFSKQASELSSSISASLKSIATVELTAQNAGQI